ncbi:MAG: hypothetical protein L3J37_07685 [Rhodobacteraceae bacterium]|nr:hypothetical protein [Paracoccaceae bacterium]
MKIIFATLTTLLAITATETAAQLRFEAGQIGVSGFSLREYIYDPFTNTYLSDDRFYELEASLDAVYSSGNFGLQAGAHVGSIKFSAPGAPANFQYGVNLHSYYISNNGNKFGAVFQYLDLDPSASGGNGTKLFGLESIVSLGRFDLETSLSSYSNSSSNANLLATAFVYAPISPSIELSTGYTYRESADWPFPLKQYTLGLEYSPQDSRFDFMIEYSAQHYQLYNYYLFQFGLNYRFGSGNTGRLFSDKTSGFGRFSP